jgi:hypothetical protein
MSNVKIALETLSALAKWERQLEQSRVDNLRAADLPKAFRDEQDAILQTQIDGVRRQKERTLSELITFPPQHDRHSQLLEAFHNTGSYDKSVFIMTKFPEGDTQLDKELKRVIKAVRDVVLECQFVPRIASDKDYHDMLWDNVELYLLGCVRAVAIVEGKYREELNPNIAMEWGWMRGMGKKVLFLVEEGFQHMRADWMGLTQSRFSWGNPEEAIGKHVRKFLGVE